ncbi:hypothetical protein [Marispirochaeta sp.]|jgi:hypothetical protein|uniref:hypothetical protein n=1 Tax=Marispirochaeta sp. TaxID=2038653 RepID=UPI0029C819F5|nr:hypothetical protein [Marispirochaeta sp.]
MGTKHFTVDLHNIDSVSETLKAIQGLLDRRGGGDGREGSAENHLSLIFGSQENGEFKEFPSPSWHLETQSGRPLTLTSEHTFFYAAGGFDIPGQIEETLERMGESMRMETDTAPLGTYAFVGLIMAGQEWIRLYAEFLQILKRFEMFHDAEETDGISAAIQTYGWTEDTLDLLAIRMFSCQGHSGGEAFQIFRDEFGLNDALEDDELLGAFEGSLRREIEELEDTDLESHFWSCGYDPRGGAPAPGEAGTPCDELMWSLIREYLVLDDEDYEYY